MGKAIRIHENGGPEVLRWEDFDPGKPENGEVLLRHEAIGLNFIDVYHRTGLYPLPSLPAVPGMEGAGIVEQISDGVTEVAVGDKFGGYRPIVWSSFQTAFQPGRLPP
jgi:NADPH2:quinone reductase